MRLSSRLFLAAICSVALLLSCRASAQSIDTTLTSRGVEIPVTYVLPTAFGKGPFPLLVMAHGHGGTRHEAGLFTAVATALARHGIASIRMDFPGCGDSTESFANNNLSNMLHDILASRDFAIAQLPVDPDRVGLFGWSMGARLMLLLAGQADDIRIVATWSPAAANGAGSMVDFLGGRSSYDSLKARAKKDGSVAFTTIWGQHQQLGYQWFTDLESSNPLQSIATFKGPLLVLHGGRDEVIPPAVSAALVTAAVNSSEVVRHIISDADHDLGFFSGNPQFAQQAVQMTVEFLQQRL